MKRRQWTEEQRQAQAALIRRCKPWEKSTGPRTEEGKAKVSRNAYKGGEAGRQERLKQAEIDYWLALAKWRKLQGKKKGPLPF